MALALLHTPQRVTMPLERALEERHRPHYHDAFLRYLRTGAYAPGSLAFLGFGPAERRALGTSSLTAGGALVSEEFERQVLVAMDKTSVIRALGTKRRTRSGGSLVWASTNDTTTVGTLITENSVVAEGDPTVGQRVLPTYTYTSGGVRVSWDLLEDAGVDLDGWLAELLGARISRASNRDFTTGASPDRPSGIVTGAAAGLTAGSTIAITWDELMSLQDAVGEAYIDDSSVGYMMNATTLRTLKQLKDGSGMPLIKSGRENGRRVELIDNYVVYTNPDMPGLAASNRAVLFGAFSSYGIHDMEGGMILLVSDERYAEVRQRYFVAFSRHGGQLLDAGTIPVAAITQAAS